MSNCYKSYEVHWIIDIEADSALEAAKEALEIMHDKESTAVVFQVRNSKGKVVDIDLLGRINA